MNTFAEGLDVKYKEFVGKIRFISEKYLTICICELKQRERNVCILVYKNEWDKITLLKESEK
jgi:hypothetical protein